MSCQFLDAEKYLCSLLAEMESARFDFSRDKTAIVAGLRQVAQEMDLLRMMDFRQIGDHINDGIYISDGNEATLYVNKAYLRMTGIQAEEVLGKKVSELVEAGMYKFAVTPEVIKLKKQINSIGESTRNGTKMLISGDPILDEAGNVKTVVATNRDITELLAMQSELEASQQLVRSVEQDKKKDKLEIEHLRKLTLSSNLIGRSQEMQQVRTMIDQIAGVDVTVLITGETGVGKEVVANEIYSRSSRKNEPFIKVNCAAIPANLLEAELFGYEKGAFTGAAPNGKVGMFELADKGALMLDEVGDMPMELQSKLLRVIQHKELTRLGGRKPIKLDVRIIAATNCDLRELVKQGKFREDLYYRLNVFPIFIPPLRLRGADIEPLTAHFLKDSNTTYAKAIRIDGAGLEMLRQYPWPGNIRELQNIVERVVIISAHNAVVGAEQAADLLHLDPHHVESHDAEMGLKEIVDSVEKRTIERTLSACGSVRNAAKILRVDHSTIVKKAKRLGIVIRPEKALLAS